MAEQRIHALEARVAELERDLAAGLTDVFDLAFHAIGLSTGMGGYDASEVAKRSARIYEIAERLGAKGP
ncbi:hypothetical protein HW537_14575 [Asaia siamensis]